MSEGPRRFVHTPPLTRFDYTAPCCCTTRSRTIQAEVAVHWSAADDVRGTIRRGLSNVNAAKTVYCRRAELIRTPRVLLRRLRRRKSLRGRHGSRAEEARRVSRTSAAALSRCAQGLRSGCALGRVHGSNFSLRLPHFPLVGIDLSRSGTTRCAHVGTTMMTARAPDRDATTRNGKKSFVRTATARRQYYVGRGRGAKGDGNGALGTRPAVVAAAVITSGGTNRPPARSFAAEGSWTRTWAGCVAPAASRLWATRTCST